MSDDKVEVDSELEGEAAELDRLGFGEAMEELEKILRRIEGDETDIDRLAVELRQAAQLLEVCREKIRRAEVEISQVVDKL